MGLIDIELQKGSLLLRWLWRPNSNPNALWSSMILRIRVSRLHGANRWNKGGSFFWKSLIRLLPLFSWSCEFQGGSIRWKWESTGQYSSRSFYLMIMTGGKEKWPFPEIWRMKTPQTVKIFCYLLLQNRILTRDVLRMRNIFCQSDCVMCATCRYETATHLLLHCEYARRVWTVAAGKMGFPLICIDQEMRTTWTRTWNSFKLLGVSGLNSFAVMFVSICWHIWLQRNSLIFRGIRVPPDITAVRALEVGKMWAENC